MHLGALSSGAADTINFPVPTQGAYGETFGNTPSGDTLVCPPGQPFDPAIQDCTGPPCIPMVFSNGVYTMPQGPMQLGQSVCPPPANALVQCPTWYTMGNDGACHPTTIIPGLPDWAVYIMGGLVLIAMLGRRG